MRLNAFKHFFLYTIFCFLLNPIFAQTNDAFKKALHFADSVYQLKEYENAKSAYEYAARFQADHAVIQSRLKEIQQILNRQADLEQQYGTAVANAKKAFYDNDETAAHQYLKTAVSIKSDPTSWANRKLKELDDAIAAKEQLQKDYNNHFTQGLHLFSEKKYEESETAFSAALKLIPDDAPAKQKIAEVRTKIQERNTAYNQYIAEGDRLYQADKVNEAKTQYQKALEQKPDEVYPKQRLQFIESMIHEESELLESVKNIVQEADRLFTAKDYEPSYLKYQAALDVYPGHPHAKERMKEIDGILGEARATQRAYEQAITSADQLFSTQRYKEAKVEYEKANGLKPNEPYPMQKINDINAIFAKLQSDEDAFNQLVTAGDEMFGNNLFEEAASNYTEALKMKPDHAGVKQKLTDATTQIAKIEKQYATLITQADNQLKIKKFIDAQVSYEQASDLKPKEEYPKRKIAEIRTTLADMQELLAQNYQEAMNAGNRFFEIGDFSNAKTEFTKAARIKPDEQEPKDKLLAVDKAIEHQKQAEAQYAALLKEGDTKFASKRYAEALTAYQNAFSIKNDDVLKTKIDQCEVEIAKIKNLEDQFNQYVADGDQYFSEAKWTEAKTAYQNAASIKADKYLSEKIKDIDSKLAQEAALEKQYATLIAQADNQLKIKKYIDAQVAYEAALNVKPSESYPQEKLTEIAAILKNQQELLDKTYLEALQQGDLFFQANDFINAKTEYTKAASVKPTEQAPKDKLIAVDQAIEKQKQTEEQFANFVKEGDTKLIAKRWAEALTAFQSADALKNDASVKSKIANCETEIAKAKNLEEQFQQLVAEGNNYFAANHWENAKTAYQSALNLKSDKSLIDKIKEVEAAMQKEAELHKQYQDLIAVADSKLKEKQWKSAIESYRNALNIKPDDPYSTEKISYAETQLRYEQEQEAAYNAFIAQGDNLIQQNNLDEAKIAYQNALTIREKASYPTNQLAVIEMKQQDMANMRKSYETLLSNTEADIRQASWKEAKAHCSQALQLFPDEVVPQKLMHTIDSAIAHIEAIDKAYQEAISHADAALSLQNREIALQQYEKAAQIKPQELYPKNKINEINAAILAEENREKDRQYQIFINEANVLLSNNAYQEAVEKYENALTVKPNDQFATNKIKETQAIIQRLGKIETDYAQFIKEGDALFLAKKYEEALTSFQNAATLKPEETYPKEQISKTQYQINFSPERRQLLAQESYQKGVDAVERRDFQTASNAFATAAMWYPENTTEVKSSLEQMRTTLMNGKSKTILNEKINIAANQTHNIKTFVSTDDLDANNVFILIKIRGEFDNNTNVFLRYGRYTVTYGNAILTVVSKADVDYYCIRMKGDKSDINWMTIVPENKDIIIEQITLVSPKK